MIHKEDECCVDLNALDLLFFPALQEEFHDRTPYTIMFGPDKCGEDYKLHFIFRHQNPLNKDVEERHAKRADVDLKKFYTDKKTHLYTLGMEMFFYYLF